MSEKMLVMLGAGGHAKVCYEIAMLMGKWEEIVILDDFPDNDFFKVSGRTEDKNKYPLADFFVAIGDNETRKKMIKELIEKKYKMVTLIHPNAVISSQVTIGKATVIMPGVVININSKIGEGCILNTKSSIDHDNKIGSFVHIAPGATLAGKVEISEKTWIGMGANIVNNICITKNSIIGAGSLVIKDITHSGTYIGTPARMVKK